MISAIGAGNICVTVSREEQFEEYARLNSSLVLFFNTHFPDENLEIARYFIAQGKIDYLNQANEDGATPLMSTLRVLQLELAELLLKHGASPNVNIGCHSLLQLAVFIGRSDYVQILLNNRVDVNYQNTEDGATALFVAAQLGHTEIARLLLLYGALFTKTFQGASPISIACQKGHLGVVKLFVQSGVRVNEVCIIDTPLVIASSSGYLKIVQFLLASGADINLTERGYTALHAACEDGHESIVDYLLENGADRNISFIKFNVSALYMAVQNGHFSIVKLFFKKKELLNEVGLKKVLHIAAGRNHKEILLFLIEQGLDVNVTNEDGSTPLMFASFMGHFAIVELLLERGVAVDICSKKVGETALFFAAKQGHADIVEFLWARGASIDLLHLVLLLNAPSLKLTVEAAERWFDRLFDKHKDPNLIIKRVFAFPLPLITVLHLLSQSGSRVAHYSALYRRLLTKEGLIIPEALVTKVARPLELEDVGGEIKESLRLMSLWGRHSNNPWGLPLEEVERIKSVKEYCKTAGLKEEFGDDYQRLVAIYDLWITRNPLLSYLQIASRNFREVRPDEISPIKPPICIVASLFNQYKLAVVKEVEKYLRENAPNRKRVWKDLRKQVIYNALQISFPEELTFIHGTTTATIPGLIKRGELLPLGVLMDLGDVAFAGELCGSHKDLNRLHISGITLPATGSILQSQYFNLTEGVHVSEFYAIGGASEHFQQGLFALDDAFSHIVSASLEELDQKNTDFLLIHIKRIKLFGHGDDPRIIDLLGRIAALPPNTFLSQIAIAIKEIRTTVTLEEKSYIERRAPVVFASSVARPEVRPHELMESFEYHSLPIPKINYAFTNPDQIPFLEEALKETGIKVDSLETLRTLSLFCMARGTWVENRISELTPMIGGAQAEITAILEGYILPNYTKPFPEKPSYVDGLGIRRELASPYFGAGITSYAQYIAQVNLQAILPRNTHGLMHAVRVAIAAQMINNLLGFAPLESWEIAACAAHDEGREDEALDHWDRKSGDHFSSTMFIATQGSPKAVIYGDAIANKDTTNLFLKTRLVEILHDADVLEMYRIFLSQPERFDKTYLYFFTNERIDIGVREGINSEWREFVRLTEDPELKFRLEFQGRSYYLEVMQLLANCVSEGRFPTIGRFLDKELKATATSYV